jgi:hypothetical protein
MSAANLAKTQTAITLINMSLEQNTDSEDTMKAIRDQLFDRIAMLEEKDIHAFRDSLSPEKQQFFDQEDEIEQTRLVALSTLATGDLEFVHTYLTTPSADSRPYLVGFHDLTNTVCTLHELLNNKNPN